MIEAVGAKVVYLRELSLMNVKKLLARYNRPERGSPTASFKMGKIGNVISTIGRNLTQSMESEIPDLS